MRIAKIISGGQTGVDRGAIEAARRGLWADPNPINPYDWRKRK